MTSTEHHLDEAVDRALRGPARDRNPRVGCVLVDPAGQVVGAGHHAGAGSPHAEVAALASAGDLASGATAYVTLEPCNHHGRTGPCARALRDAGVVRVVYAVPDPTAQAGGGAAWLRAHGIPVERCAHPAAEALVSDWARARTLGRPHVTWKIASTLDGRVAAADGSSRWITSAEARQDAHRLRSRVDAVVVGTGTALADDPALTARTPDGAAAPVQPVRVVVGLRDLPPGARLGLGPDPALHLRTRDPHEVLAALTARGVHSVLLEGGPTLAGAFWRAGCVDEVLVYLAPALLGAGASAVPDLGVRTIDDCVRLELAEVRPVGPDLRLRLVPGRLAPSTPPGHPAVHALVPPVPSSEED
ncbi:bifunctional diaminohydroxyphosphoribosylaminopyrimidine deaminase/5-amino-6-(5-phosphoribosylamino)uracil reductase RibD [Ornithinimicrobium cerasi]|uniref:Riboflavin biosynthesis protein RibD n=1 Tax=Ornithinimicrobium cerasi TaxID=2248773 RepID=A0A285VQ25_9MICO|nr:bifunctional diaminohydroxyphosphoribosylaminopyrimidine deaminase/5-amino-6-(5-phosphoribosylamino)uracil reductase RibD [Ornithinimicrobium cerasi]SOC55997.1 diaminohydroxyphosphoribosylaminopyrimidine deaminase / 5-amino-6-(5-phosphoribosylamino)uracil reductase [Ornithinimicrobium cerasi]